MKTWTGINMIKCGRKWLEPEGISYWAVVGCANDWGHVCPPGGRHSLHPIVSINMLSNKCGSPIHCGILASISLFLRGGGGQVIWLCLTGFSLFIMIQHFQFSIKILGIHQKMYSSTAEFPGNRYLQSSSIDSYFRPRNLLHTWNFRNIYFLSEFS